MRIYVLLLLSLASCQDQSSRTLSQKEALLLEAREAVRDRLSEGKIAAFMLDEEFTFPHRNIVCGDVNGRMYAYKRGVGVHVDDGSTTSDPYQKLHDECMLAADEEENGGNFSQ
jgi:hypothetical protein